MILGFIVGMFIAMGFLLCLLPGFDKRSERVGYIKGLKEAKRTLEILREMYKGNVLSSATDSLFELEFQLSQVLAKAKHQKR